MKGGSENGVHRTMDSRSEPSLPATTMLPLLLLSELPNYSMGRIVPPFRQLYQETISDLQTELKAALVDLGHKGAFDQLLKEAWNPEVAALGNSTGRESLAHKCYLDKLASSCMQDTRTEGLDSVKGSETGLV